MNLRLALILTVLCISKMNGQTNARIIEETLALDTYDFHSPNPIPIVVDNPKIAPYFKYEGYSHSPVKKEWKVVTLENDYIKLWVLPEIGGKVWGAIDKGTGEEFLYKNEVVKFRNIAMRGPWTSGGIEFNFGIIGHHPATATPVDYSIQTHTDGSVSCFVGSDDLPSNTKWMVEIRLEKDKAFFETNASWYNASPLTESYYNWMTAAAVATDDLEFFIPGNAYVEHNGTAHPWPIDPEGRNLAMYRNNSFGPAKSYHIVGEYNDFFGGYYHDRNFGYGQWAPYEEMPGQKLWLWALSRSGGIWEDLLTDTDGQYIEFQAGRLFDQYFPGAVNPISQVGFDPYVMDTWSEIWFPYKEIGGMEDASRHGVLNVEYENGEVYIGLNALQRLDQELQVSLNGKKILVQELDLRPMEIFSTRLVAKPTDRLMISVIGTELEYTNDPEAKRIKRPFYPDPNLRVSEMEERYQSGMEALEYRAYDRAHKELSELLKLDPSHRAGILGLAELEYRRTNYTDAMALVNRVLKMDTYNSKANYLAGITYRALNDPLNALESFGWAARDIKYRSVAYAQMAEVHLKERNYHKAKIYAAKALTFNLHNINAREVLLLTAKSEGDNGKLAEYAQGILDTNPLQFLAKHQLNRTRTTIEQESVLPGIDNELPEETVLNLAIRYDQLGFGDEALMTLLEGPKAIKNGLWVAYLQSRTDSLKSCATLNKMVSEQIDMVFPYRRETVAMLEWAVQQMDHWKLKYYLAQNYLAVQKKNEAIALLASCSNKPDSDIFYRFRAKVLENASVDDQLADYKKAFDLNPMDWKVNEEVIQFYLSKERYEEALKWSSRAYRKFHDNYAIGMAHAKALLYNGKYQKVVQLLRNVQVLPFEHASESREIYERAHKALAVSLLQKNTIKKALEVLEKSREWPENIGVGRPYDPDERSQEYLTAIALEKMGNSRESEKVLRGIIDRTYKDLDKNSQDHLYGLLAAKKLGDAALDEFLNVLKTTENTASSVALALFQATADDLADLRSKSGFPDDEWHVLSWVLQP